MKMIPRSLGIALIFLFSGCGLFGSGTEEVKSQPGRTVYRTTAEAAENPPEVRSTDKVPGESR